MRNYLWTIRNNGFSHGELDPKYGEFNILEDIHEMSVIAIECAKMGIRGNKKKCGLDEYFEPYKNIETWKRDAIIVTTALAELDPESVCVPQIKYDHQSGCTLSGNLKDLNFLAPLFQAAMYEWGMTTPLLFQCVDRENNENKIVAIGMEGWSAIPVEDIVKNPFTSIFNLISATDSENSAFNMLQQSGIINRTEEFPKP